MALGYGRKVFDMWGELDMQDVYEDWADELQGCSIGAIKFATETAKKELLEKPPTQGQFIAFCKKYQPVGNVHRLAHRLTPEQLEANKKRIAELAAGLIKKKSA